MEEIPGPLLPEMSAWREPAFDFRRRQAFAGSFTPPNQNRGRATRFSQDGREAKGHTNRSPKQLLPGLRPGPGPEQGLAAVAPCPAETGVNTLIKG
jgi:hypothetical protein